MLIDSYIEVIDNAITMWYLALRHARRTIHMRCAILIQAMPMDAGRLVTKLVADCDNQTFAFGNVKCGNWPFSVDAHHRPIKSAVWVAVDPCDVELEVCGFCASDPLKEVQ